MFMQKCCDLPMENIETVMQWTEELLCDWEIVQ